MPPKKHARPSTPPSSSKRAKKTKAAQPSIASFFISPKKESSNAVIDFVDSDDEEAETDGVMAKRLAEEWKQVEKGKGKAKQEVKVEVEVVDDDIVEIERPDTKLGINGSSSSTRSLSPKREPKPVASIFAPAKASVELTSPAAGPTTPKKEVKAESHPFTPQSTIASTHVDSCEPIDFDTDAFRFRPSDIDTSHWPKGRLPYSILVGVYVQVSSTRSRLTIVRVLTNFLHLLLHASPLDLPPSLYLLSNHLLPSYLSCELGIGSQILNKTIQDVSGLASRDLRSLWQKYGDVGDVAFYAKSNLRTLVKPAPLLVGDLYTRLLSLSKVSGKASGKTKGEMVRKMMVQARGEEVRFLVRSLVGNLRRQTDWRSETGTPSSSPLRETPADAWQTLLTSLARATALLHTPAFLISAVRPIPPPAPKAVQGQKRIPKAKIEPDPAREEVEERCIDAVKLVRKVYVRHPNYGDLVRGLSGVGLEGLEERVPVSVGIPLSPMLGSITRSLGEVFTRLGSLPFTAEAKLDGQRVQIHARLEGPEGEEDGGGRWVVGEDGSRVWVRLFSRHLEEMTEKYPDVCQLVHSLIARPLATNPAQFPSTASAPDPTAADLLHSKTITSLIIDAEIVAIDKDSGAHRTFQELSNRAKKDVKVEDIKVVVGVFAFDLMLLNDKPLLDSPFSHRRHLLRTLILPLAPSDPTLARFSHIESIDSTSYPPADLQAEVATFFQMVVEQKCEGLMVKLLESGEGITGDDEEDDLEAAPKGSKGGKKKPLPATYEPDQRSQGWLKVKKGSSSIRKRDRKLNGSVDRLSRRPGRLARPRTDRRMVGSRAESRLVVADPLGVPQSRDGGSRSGLQVYVCLLLAGRAGEVTDSWVGISGFTDAFYKDLLVRYPPEGEPEKCSKYNQLGYYETNGLRPDVWFCPSEVWELRGADITLSPVYPAAASLLGGERGLSIRFPRFMKIREDKGWEEASTSQQFAEMFRNQSREAPSRVKVEEVRIGSEERDVDGEIEEVEEEENREDGEDDGGDEEDSRGGHQEEEISEGKAGGDEEE
ncbi:DNA ligase 1, partial [Tremellales sp. Uapishka_1]